jgi:hypothetical protein
MRNLKENAILTTQVIKMAPLIFSLVAGHITGVQLSITRMEYSK